MSRIGVGIADDALLSDWHSTTLIGRSGSVEWLSLAGVLVLTDLLAS
jgi:hypothetical protein